MFSSSPLLSARSAKEFTFKGQFIFKLKERKRAVNLPTTGRILRYAPLSLASRNQAVPGRLCTRNHFRFSPCRSSHPRNLEKSCIISSIQHSYSEPLTVHQVGKASRFFLVDLIRNMVTLLLHPQTGSGQEPGSVGILLSLAETDQGTLRPGTGK